MSDSTLENLRGQLVNGAVRYRRRRRQRTAAATTVAAAVVGTSVYLLASGDPADNHVVTAPSTIDSTTSSSDRDGTTSTTSSQPPSLEAHQKESAELVVSQFIERIRDGDLSAAAERWTGYPDVLAEDPAAKRVPFIEDLTRDPEFARILEAGNEIFVTPSWGFTSADPVVTVLAPSDDENPPAAVSFLVEAEPGTGNDSAPARIQRIPMPNHSIMEPDIASGSEVSPGRKIQVPVLVVEGGARLHVNGIEVPITLDEPSVEGQDISEPPTSTVIFTIPHSTSGDIAVTISVSTPEYSAVRAFTYTVRAD